MKNKKLCRRVIDASRLSKHYFDFELINIIIEIKSYKKRKKLLYYLRLFIVYGDVNYLLRLFVILKIEICFNEVIKNLCID